MPPIRSYAEFPINPVKPNQLLPLPGMTKQTGLLCPSCRKPHSTSYFTPAKQGHEPLIGVTCRASRYIRSYSLAQAKSAVIKHNLLLQRRAVPSSTLTQEQADYNYAMQVLQLINGDMPGAISSNQNNGRKKKPSKPLPTDQQCSGYLGQFATGHTAHKNAGCAIQACRNCCEQLKPLHLRCSKHNAMTKPNKAPVEARDVGVANRTITQTPSNQLRARSPSSDFGDQDDIDPILTQGPTPTQARPATQAAQRFASPLTPAQVNRFRTTTIQKQAQECEDKDNAKVAENTVTFVVWAGLDDDPCGFETWRVYAPRWPNLSLNNSHTLMEQVRNKFGNEWNGDLRVWIPDEKAWVKMQTSIVEPYNPTYRRILIVFPGVNIATCQGMETNLESVRTMTVVQKMDMKSILNTAAYTRFKTPSAIRQANMQISLISDNKDEVEGDEGEVEQLNMSSPDLPEPNVVETLIAQKPMATEPASSSTSTANAPEAVAQPKDSKAGWPTSPTTITMKSLQRYLTLTLAPLNLTSQLAFAQEYGKTHEFTKSTVNKYHKWLKDYVGVQRLSEYVQQHPNHTVLDGLDFFRLEWQELDKRRKKNATRATRKSPE
ncbi:uncharacterized protein MELLADRAFT_93173 [Melampsora larici-populina 98AG31]|uniref:Uncharacterized protein n=1 Tax=Melampsora larici-populina (strain 98AG31 / pathotype 3-4-7) TaxID=747676 RepID=F4S4C6_MELLP|nr:uncharacterized protein MELLADRAFT_93173 [Melampsora larici-populina 98AG31]EGG00502.1 hypothetical protein MELLADRAFT_93173 [Melampsora larici-populina 98AG31]